MRLSKILINGFRSVKGTETLITAARTTILIGANDHGKSNLLSAIFCLNDEQQITTDDRNWDLDASDPVEITWHFHADADAMEKLSKLQPDFFSDEATKLDLGSLRLFPENGNGEIVFSRDLESNTVKVVSLPVTIPVTQESEILALRPKVELFESPSGNVVDQVTLAQLGTPPFEFMQGIFRLAGLWPVRDSVFTQNDTTSRKLKEASATLTKILNDQWNQGKDLKWIFEHTGTNGDTIVIKIEDPAIGERYTRPSLRSSGFKTYFLLSMIIYARSQNKPSDSNIYLFDEPGTYLHPSAQLDLQRSFEAIADQAQLIYTTHSLFLINKNYPSRNRVISKTVDGSKIDQKPFTRNWKSVRQSLGILLSNNFLIADKTLLVEGPSDAIYFLDAVKRLKSSSLIDVDLNDMSIVDAGDSQNYVAMAKIMLSEGRSLVALTDGDSAGKKLQQELQRTCEAEIKLGKLQIHLLPENKSSEDLFADPVYLRNAIKRAFRNLTEEGFRTAKDGVDIQISLEEIKDSEAISLGRVIENVTKTWFSPPEKISKLLISVLYEDELESVESTPAARTLKEIKAITDLLSLRGEKSTRFGVFEDVNTIL